MQGLTEILDTILYFGPRDIVSIMLPIFKILLPIFTPKLVISKAGITYVIPYAKSIFITKHFLCFHVVCIYF